ncbi:MAG: flagellar biosynthesis protein FlhB [Oscillibacter sp.]|nr:flagellar biosynthesis protein FlhB [Oscillibacter sp.]
MPDDSKTEKATPKKRRDERKKGHVFLSKDAVSVASLFGSIIVMRATFAASMSTVGAFMAACIQRTQTGGIPNHAMLLRCVSLIAEVTGPFLVAAALLSVIATLAQTRLLVSFELIKPKMEKINPLKGFQNLFSMRSVVEALKNLLKVSILLYLIYASLRDLMGISERYLYADLNGASDHLFGAIFAMLLRVAMAFLALAGLDFFYQWWDYEKQMRMSKQEIKEEYKQTEGDPQIKGRIKELQRRAAQQRMMQQVPKADVIVRNPEHVAVALRYKPYVDEAPLVLAKGLDALALRIVAIAEEHDITVVENVTLARALYAKSELYHSIPPDLYEEVAEIMVYLYKLGRVKA